MIVVPATRCEPPDCPIGRPIRWLTSALWRKSLPIRIC